MTFSDWREQTIKRDEAIYSVAIKEGIVVSSIVGNKYYSERMINLWHTQENHRQSGYGKLVLLNILDFIIENYPKSSIIAWDVTSERVDSVLIKYGFT